VKEKEKDEALLPCPFCGGTDIVSPYDDGNTGGMTRYFRYKCNTCGVSPFRGKLREKDEWGARFDWNTRAQPATAHNNGSTPCPSCGLR
jgi:Lar family restriction alleviation protein